MSGQGNPKLSFRIPADLYSLLEQKAEADQSDLSKTVILALKNLLQPPDPLDELSEVKRRLSSLEAAMQRISHDPPPRR